jgi:hypothetical protein
MKYYKINREMFDFINKYKNPLLLELVTKYQ